ncbi:response regulator [Croceicoccus gelatinilyticus]|uniref:response regulator n=1 Tax=Croceicoccus gelatinilyticus TaxID=2835536 RepID=UPI001BCFFA92|nr:response regulator [Croceicoccus gelatinilyticus]MBS7669121.1 response regulator [Croceicoccus gelatinilyticus]
MADWGYEKTDFEAAGATPIVLLVEDEMIIAFDMADQLACSGFTVDGPYPSNAKALAALNGDKPNVAILDVQLTDGDVYPVADKLRDLGVPIVFHSGHADPQELRRDYPEAIVCTKPCPNGQLEDAIRQVLQAHA